MRRAIFVLTLALAGCAGAPRLPEPVDWPMREAQLQSLQAWRMSGRVAVSVDGEGASASLDWRQSGEISTLALNGPFGVGGLHAVLSPAGLSLEDGSGTRLAGEDATRVLAQKLGTDLPLVALRYWLLGVPAPGLPAEAFPGPDGRPASFTQAGWRVGIDAYMELADGGLPRRLTAVRDGARVRLAVSRWEIGP
jgi:outer membrane lipoprotein LolB